MVDLDAMIQRAREAAVRRDVAEDHVRELERWTVRSAPRRWPGWLAVTTAAAALAVALVVVLARRGDSPDTAPLAIGDRVAIVAEPGTSYRIVRASGDDTAIEVDRGVVTARLWPGDRAHRLTLEGGGVVATAKGTLYSLTVDSGGGAVHVDEGTVDVRVGAEVHTVAAGASWPPDRARPASRATSVLALTAPPRAPTRPMPAPGGLLDPAPASSPPAAGGEASDSARPEATSRAASGTVSPAADAVPTNPASSSTVRASAPRAHAASSSPQLSRADASATPRPGDEPVRAAATIKDRWRAARQLRAEGKLRAAVAECLIIADARDPTWSPIALLEAARIHAGPLPDAAQVIALADRVIHEWPGDALVPEARQQRCRALSRLGRGGECTAPPP